MKYRVALAVSLFALNAGSYTTAPYQEKEQDIQRETNYAEKYNNQSRVDGLNETLSEVRADYTDSRPCANHQRRIVEQKNEIAERQRDLAGTKQKGDADRITKREHKPAEAQQESKEFETRDY